MMQISTALMTHMVARLRGRVGRRVITSFATWVRSCLPAFLWSLDVSDVMTYYGASSRITNGHLDPLRRGATCDMLIYELVRALW